VIARSTLLAFVANRVDNSLKDVVKDHLEDWFRRTSRATWRSSAQLKADFGSASIISADRVVFNIKGNDFRLIAGVDYRR
jgi:mRNA interferase HigB